MIGCNEYIGWYDGLPAKADTIAFKTAYDKPMVMSELGGEAPFGRHGDEDTAWTEEYQANVLSSPDPHAEVGHGVLFRGNAEAEIRRELVRKGYIKGIIGLPPNLFYGTGIPACIVVVDKEDAQACKGIFMIDASADS